MNDENKDKNNQSLQNDEEREYKEKIKRIAEISENILERMERW